MTTSELVEKIRRMKAQQETAMSGTMVPEPAPDMATRVRSQLQMPAPQENVPAPGPVSQHPYVQAEQLEAEAQPRSTQPQDWKEILGESLLGAMQPGGYAGRMQNRQVMERQRQQDVMERVKAAKQQGFQQQQLYQQDQNQVLNRATQQEQYGRQNAMDEEQLKIARARQALEERNAGQSQAGMGAMGTYYQSGPQAGQIITPAPTQTPTPRNIDRLSPEGIEAELELERRKKTTGGDTPGQLSGLAQAALRDPTILRGLTPTARGAIYNELGKSGQVPPSQFLTVVRRTLDSIQRIKEMPGKSGAVGAKGPMSGFGLKERPFAGSEAGAYRLALDQLKSNLTIPELEMMRGLGHMSDVEFNTIAKAATTLDADQQEKAYDDELTRVEQAMTQIWNRLTGPAAPNRDQTPAVGGTFNGARVLSVEEVK